MKTFLQKIINSVVIKNLIKRFIKVAGYVLLAIIMTPAFQSAFYELVGVWLNDSPALLLVNAIIAALFGIIKDSSSKNSIWREVL